MQTTFDVRVWKTKVYKGKRGTAYYVRWEVAGQEFTAPFKTAALADAERSKLVLAMSKGEAFDIASGRPLSALSKAAGETTWFGFAVEYVDANWRRWSGNNRKNVARTFTAVTMATLRTAPPERFELQRMRTALREFAYNSKRRSLAPDDIVDILTWVERHSSPMSAWTDAQRVEAILATIDTKLDGEPCAKSTVKRHRRVLNPAMKRAVAKRILPNNPLPKLGAAGGKSNRGLDKRCLISPEQAGQLLGWVHDRPRGGRRLHAFFATMYYCGLRPEEAVALRVHDATLPEVGWGELMVHTATPEVGKQWSTSGEVHDRRSLKGRDDGETRPVPIHPALVRVLREHVSTCNLKARDLLFPGENGGILAGSVIRRAWGRAREKVLTDEQYASPLGKRVYDLRHTCLTRWLNEGVPPAQVAEWAGNSVEVLLRTYARVVSGQAADIMKRIESALDITTQYPAGP